MLGADICDERILATRLVCKLVLGTLDCMRHFGDAVRDHQQQRQQLFCAGGCEDLRGRSRSRRDSNAEGFLLERELLLEFRGLDFHDLLGLLNS